MTASLAAPTTLRPAAPPLTRDVSPLHTLLRTAGVLFSAIALTGCPTPPTPKDKASEAAHELNLSARWGRMDIAVTRSAREDQEEFMKRRSLWHNGLRIVDTELAGLHLHDSTHATVQVDVSWLLDDNTSLRLTRIEQEWKNEGGRWVMTTEKRVGGSLGLFGEKVERDEARKDVHFPSRTIR